MQGFKHSATEGREVWVDARHWDQARMDVEAVSGRRIEGRHNIIHGGPCAPRIMAVVKTSTLTCAVALHAQFNEKDCVKEAINPKFILSLSVSSIATITYLVYLLKALQGAVTYQSENNRMPGLVDLPNELATEIIHSVLCISNISVPLDTKRHRVEGPGFNTRVCYIQSREAYRPNALDLLLTCRKLHTLTTDYISRTPQTWKLDISIINDHWLFPTWRYIAPRAGLVDGVERLKINIIPCFTEDEREKTTTWLDNELPPMRKAECITYLRGYIERVLAFGPLNHLEGDRMSVVVRFYIKRLVRDWTVFVSDAYYGSGNDTLSTDEVPLRSIEGLAHLDFDPLYPVDSATCGRLSDIMSFIS
jgi:hypothetical protein